PECKPSAPGRKNAWLIDRVRDNIISCAPPDYSGGYPPAIAYMICDRLRTSQCAPSIDGTQNGFLLAAGASCKSPRVKSLCWHWSMYVTSRPSEPKPGGRSPLDVPSDRTEELEFWSLAVILNDATCGC